MLSSHCALRRRAINLSMISQCGFGGIVGDYRLRHMCPTLSTSIVPFSCTGPRVQAGVNPYRDCAEIVRKIVQSQCSCHACSLLGLGMEIIRSLCGLRAAAARRWCCDRATVVPFFERAASARCPSWDYVMPPKVCLRAMHLQFL